MQTLSKDECLKLLQKNNTPPAVVAHCIKTAELAAYIGQTVNDSGENLSIPLIETAALLHDIAKTSPNHAKAGADILREQGLNLAAEIVELHMDYQADEAEPLTEIDIVYLSDKLLTGTELRSLEDRRMESLTKKGKTSEIRKAINRRFDSAEKILNRVKNISGVDIIKTFS
ncbi:MAG: HD domain-containing protein [Spirochaetales bacterium]|nr:HD domain-containing protein [Spirochaetales bacterium]